MELFWILFALSVVFSGLFVILHSPEKPVFSFFLKGVATLSVISSAFACAFSSGALLTTSGILIVLALSFCLFGDCALANLEFKLQERKQNIIISGELGFSMAQIVLIVSIIMINSANLLAVLLPFAFGLVFAGGVYIMKKPLHLDFGKTTLVSLFYSFCLGTSFAQTFALCLTQGFTTFATLMFVGMLLFVISDLVLSTIYFGDKDDKIKRTLYYPNYITYYGAIVIIALSLAFFI